MQIVHRVNAPPPGELSQSSHASPAMGRGESISFFMTSLSTGERVPEGRVRGLSLIERPCGRARMHNLSPIFIIQVPDR